MSLAYTTVMGHRGHVVIPEEWCEHAGLREGTPFVMLATNDGLVLATRDQLKRLVRRNVGSVDLVAELLAERRRQAFDEGLEG
jgi:bifunctional DNA-binding transcriptional regulator/antitoxin component of YhaV-PrlF toxin-antitoxin module